MPECWRIIGVSGDRSCPELQAFIHCRNCPVLADAARTFFDRDAPEGYLDSWRAILEEPTAQAEQADTSVLVFRVDREWLALPSAALVEVTASRTLHTVPHRTGTALAGLVNIRGQLQLCVSLHKILGLSGGPAGGSPPTGEPAEGTPRLIVVERTAPQSTERWVLGVDDVAGVHRVGRGDLRPVPSTVSQAAARCSSALFEWQERTVALLDESRLFDALRDMVSP
ncbi:MAG: chemotaxis protein CheW [Planctomycetia bacterium]|nr:chemotaxis protein CheW [Planctomycetia bacterium]